MPGRGAVFLDRDGTVIEDRHYLSDPDGVLLISGAAAAIARLNRAALPVILVTNQSGIGRGYFDEAAFQAVQGRLHELLRVGGAYLDGVYHCPHSPDAQPPCSCRKPAPGLFVRAAAQLGVSLSDSFLIGDRLRDVEPALEFGATGILVGAAPNPELDRSPNAHRFPRVPSVFEAVELILGGRGLIDPGAGSHYISVPK